MANIENQVELLDVKLLKIFKTFEDECRDLSKNYTEISKLSKEEKFRKKVAKRTKALDEMRGIAEDFAEELDD